MVREKLLNYPETRDNDNKLIAHVLADIECFNLRKITAQQFLENLKEGEYGIIESIGRCRRKLQEGNEDLRGRLWRKRHGYQEEVKQQLRMDF